MSPTPGRSILITSAPNQARSCVQVGPDCTCVKSRIRTPSSALPAWPKGFFEGGGNSDFVPFFFGASLTTFADERLAVAFFAAGLERAFAGFLAFFLAIGTISLISVSL